MKKLIYALLLVLMLSTPLLAVQDWSRQSSTQTASAAITASPGYFHGIVVMTDGTNAVTVNIYDHATAGSGTKLIPTWTVTTSSSNRAQTYSLTPPVRFYNGCYVTISTSGTASYMVYWQND